MQDVLREHLIALRPRLKPADLARKLGVTPQMAGKILKRKRGLSVKHFEAVAALLGEDLDVLVKRRPTGGRTGQSAAPSNAEQAAQKRADFTRIDPGHGVEQATSAITPGPHHGAAPLPTHADLARNLFAASRTFLAMSLQCRKWNKKLAQLASDVAGGQVPIARAAGPVNDDGSGTNNRQDTGTRAKRRKAG